MGFATSGLLNKKNYTDDCLYDFKLHLNTLKTANNKNNNNNKHLNFTFMARVATLEPCTVLIYNHINILFARRGRLFRWNTIQHLMLF